MMSQQFDEMKRAVLEGDEELARELATNALAHHMDLKEVMSEGFLKGIQEAGVLYEEGEYFLPDLVCSADAMKSALEVLDEEIKKPSSGMVSKGKVLLATVQGDVHDIGKTIVGAMLTAAGYEVTDLGPDVPNETVISKAVELQVDIIGLSALLTTTMEEQRNLINSFEANGHRGEFRIIVGGAPVTHSWSEKIRADGYSDDAIGAVNLVNSLLK
jgi:corrinoid protein of di/trimethylamine methyltransferase